MFEKSLPENSKTLLKKIKPVIESEKFYLAGGTGLALQIGHRISEDLDFFRQNSFNPEVLSSTLMEKINTCEQIIMEKDTLIAIFDGVRVSFFKYEVPLIFETIAFDDLKIADWHDIVAEKFKTVAQRGSKKDFYDIFYVVKSKNISIRDMVMLVKNRFNLTNLNLYHVLRSLTYFEDADGEPDPTIIEKAFYNWNEVKSFFTENIKEFERYFISKQ